MKFVYILIVTSIFSSLEVETSNVTCPNCKTERQRFQPSDLKTRWDGRRYGYSVSINGDNMIIGRIYGSTYVFKYKQGEWKQLARLAKPSGARAGFGISVAINKNHAAVGEVGWRNRPGAVYIFKKVNGTWNYKGKLSTPKGAAHFGYSVAMEENILVVSSVYDGVNGFRSGAVYIFEHISGKVCPFAWTQIYKIAPSDGMRSNLFGHSVAIDGEYVAIGAKHNNDKDEETGALYIYKRVGNKWLFQEKHVRTDSTGFDQYGQAVAMKDGYIVVSGEGEEPNGLASGAVYVYKKHGNHWIQDVKLSPSDGKPNDYFGSSVAIDTGYIAVGSRRGHYAGKQPGTAYVFKLQDGKWVESAKLISSDGQNGGNCGFAIAVNKRSTAVGCPYYNENSKKSSGVVNIYGN